MFMEIFRKKKRQLIVEGFVSSMRDLIELTIENNSIDQSRYMNHMHYLLECKTLVIAAPRQIGKTELLKEIFSKHRTLYICHNQCTANEIARGFTNRRFDFDIVSISKFKCPSPGIDFSSKYDLILFDECFTGHNFENVYNSLQLYKTMNYNLTIIALQSPAMLK